MNSIGQLRYTDNWLICECCPELGRLYRNLFYREHYFTRKLSRPLCTTHITIVRNYETPTYPEFWNKHAGKLIEFEYYSPVQNNGYYYWLSANSEKFSKIRTELGLTMEPAVPYHVTFGHEDNTYMQTTNKEYIKQQILNFLEEEHTHTQLTEYVSSLNIHIRYNNLWHEVWKDLIDNNLVSCVVKNNVMLVKTNMEK